MAFGLTPLRPGAIFGPGHPFLTGLQASEGEPCRVLASVDPGAYEVAAFRALGVTCPARLDRAVDVRRAGYLSGRIATRVALWQLGVPWTDLAADDNGVPLWPEGVAGSISHTAGVAFAVVSRGHARIGADIEAVPDGAALQALRDVALSEAERTRLPAPWQATLGFSAKETLYKALFPELRTFFGFDAAEVVALSDTALDLRLCHDLNADHRAGRLYRLCWDQAEGRVATWLAEGAR
ncbi:4'-phosphopantetheinyl transferase family protein [Roseivivax sediminis]|uniref:4'-phosphopantetheinyl transferase family protein n=1 Tax=Roseivivax sediminis TaxID=936889 RepID=UPI00165FCD3D|nr:4'-phosphopantetheinyl transferase superfamily protein [Roseivivax sediminis]